MNELLATGLPTWHPSAPEPGSPRPSGPPDRPGGTLPTAEFEAAFLTEMMKHAGFGRALGDQAGGETGFSDLLVREVAERIAQSRPLGIGAMLGAAAEGER